MDRELIIQLAQETIFDFPNEDPFDFTLKTLQQRERFAELVAAHEREECAKLCDAQAGGRRALEHYAALTYSGAANDCAGAIRNRK